MIEFKLTQKQEAFCCAYIETGNASEAYRRAYDAAQMLPATVNRKAVDLMDDAKIAARLKELRQPAVEKAQITLESHLAELASLRDAARKVRDYSAAIRAEIARGKAASLYAERLEVTHQMTLADLIEAAGQRAGPWVGEHVSEVGGGHSTERLSAAGFSQPEIDNYLKG
jgi:phage terminase small subunit